MVSDSQRSLGGHMGHAGQRLDVSKVHAGHRGAKTQMAATLSGAVLLFFCLLAIAITWYQSYRNTEEALEMTSIAFRKAKAKTLSEQIAVLIRPTWSVTRQFVDRLATTSEQDGITVFPPTPETFSNHTQLSAYARALAPYVNREVHLRSTDDQFTDIKHNNFVSVVMVLALGDDDQPVSSPATCTKVVWGAFMLNSTTLEDYQVEVSFLDPSDPVSDTDLIPGVNRGFWYFNHRSYTLADAPYDINLEHQLPCAGFMGPLWQGEDGRENQLTDFYNFTWFGPYDPNVGWGNLFEGSVPIYNDNKDQIGRVSAGISMGKSIGPILADIMNDNVLAGGAAALYTEDDVIMGLSEAGASKGDYQAVSFDNVTSNSLTGKAIAEVKRAFGVLCPAKQEFLTLDEILVDVTPFYPEQYGMPPMPLRWCQLMTLPRENVYQAIDDAQAAGVVVGVSCIVGFVFAITLLGGSLFLAIRTQVKMTQERQAQSLAIVYEAEDCISSMMSPMVLVRAAEFLQVAVLECYEVWRNRGKITVLDSIDQVKGFKESGNLIVFFSHQWLGWSFPDTSDCCQLKVMQTAVQHFVREEKNTEVYVWVDYICIAQNHRESQAMAVGSLPVYVSLVDRFVICAPSTRHRDSDAPVGLTSYSRRGWCRAEMLAKACGSGLQNMYVCAGEAGEMRPFTEEDMSEVSLNVYAGDFTDKRDAEKLVTPILGLYSLILKQHDQEYMQSIKEHIVENKDSFFPESYKIEEKGKQKVKKLFGDLVPLMEKHIREGGSQKSLVSR